MDLKELAPAKINLALHVRGKLSDGRHKIETVFAFCTDGDEVSATASDDLSLSISGPFARELGDSEDNIALKAARALRERRHQARDHLEPVRAHDRPERSVGER